MTSFAVLFSRACSIDRSPPDAEEGLWAPSVDVYEAAGELVVEVELPGTPPEAIRVVCDGRALLIEGGAADRERMAAVERFLRVERASGAFRRVLPLPWPVDQDRGRARLQDGLLTIRLPRPTAAR